MKTTPKLRLPPPKAWQNILHDFELMPTQAETLKITLEEALDAISHYQANLQNQLSRSALVKGLKNFEKALGRLHDECRRSAHLLEHFLPNDTLAFIGQSLTFSAASEVLGSSVFPKKCDLEINRMQAQRERITLELIETFSRPMRETLGLKYGHVLLSHFVERIHAPLARWIEMKRLDAGGRPGDAVRNYLIYQLAEAAPEIIGKPARVAVTGKFVDLCTSVFQACGLPEDGIAKAIPAIVRKLRADQEKWAKFHIAQ
jgi:hypothetical protein